MILIRLLSTELRTASSGTVSMNAGAIAQCALNAYTMTKITPTSVVNTMFTNAAMNRSVSDRTFCSLPSVSPLR